MHLLTLLFTCQGYNVVIDFIVSLLGLNTPVEMKLKLISIFRHMHYDLQLTAKVN